jgi:hypothetical protein
LACRANYSKIKNQKIKTEIKIKNEVMTMPSGGYRPGAGRPRKNPIDKKLEGKTSGANAVSQPKPKRSIPKM